jgi:hypothetical protein
VFNGDHEDAIEVAEREYSVNCYVALAAIYPGAGAKQLTLRTIYRNTFAV